MNTVRQAAARICRVLITLFAAAVIVEVFPAGSSRTASAPCASISARLVGADPDTGTGTGGAGRVRRLRT
jgi:hypothetical protein